MSRSTARILLVDDEEANLRFLAALLEEEGYADVLATPDPTEVEPLRSVYRPDLVLLDLHMPGMDGFAVMDRLRAALAPTDYLPILVMTGDASAPVRQRALASGATDFVTKPFDSVELVLRIRNLLHLRALHVAQRDQNRLLEERVAERTRELEVALRRAEAAREAKTQFLAKMSHELRTPLSPIRGALELLREGELPPSAVPLVQMATKNTDRMVDLINDILLLQSIEQEEVRVDVIPTAVEALLRETASEVEARADAAGLELRLDLPERSRPVATDPGRLADVLRRLLDNALRFTRQGRITLRLQTDAAGNPTRIEVSDTGAGIAAAHQAVIFEPFEQADNSNTRRYEGAGIGLAICRALSSLLGHRLELQSEQGRGSTFAVVLDATTTGEREGAS